MHKINIYKNAEPEMRDMYIMKNLQIYNFYLQILRNITKIFLKTL